MKVGTKTQTTSTRRTGSTRKSGQTTKRRSNQRVRNTGDRAQIKKADQAKATPTSNLTSGLAENFGGGGKGLLTRGSQGDQVKDLQRQLNEKLGLDLKVDGDYGRDTQKAVRDFQKAQGLSADGKVGNDTWGALSGNAPAKGETKADAKADQPKEAGAVEGVKPGADNGKFTNPVPSGRLTSKFGRRKAPKKGASTFHKGIDLAAPTGTRVGSSRAGEVTRSGYDKGGYGNWVEVRHADGTTSRYGHLNKRGVKVGDKVGQGGFLGSVGNTGVSTGSHLHFEIRDAKGRPVNPLNYIKV